MAVVRHRRWPLAGVFAVALTAGLILSALYPSATFAESHVSFPRPGWLEPRVQFWVDVFSYYSYRDFVVLDAGDVNKIYQVFHLLGSGAPDRQDVRWTDAYLKDKYGMILERLASGAAPADSVERRVAAMFKGEPLSAYQAAASNLRVQEGMRERFRQGLLRSRHYRSSMQRVFREFGLPPELVVLAQIESNFARGARSGAGAVGIWQFTRSTGRRFMRISRHRDDRLSPTRSTQAAAKLLRYNYNLLGDWPLAITAYNYGTAGTMRAAEQCDNDYCKVLRDYSAPRFGYAVKNYYAEFLAALQVHRYEDDYFPGIQNEEPPPLVAMRHRARHHHRARRHARHHLTAHHRVRRSRHAVLSRRHRRHTTVHRKKRAATRVAASDGDG